MRSPNRTVVVVALASSLLSATAAAQSPEEEQFLIGTTSPRLAARPLWATGFGGYDSARASAVVGAAAELAVARWLAVRAGFYYVPTGKDNDNVRPNVGLRAQILRQDSEGLDGAVALNYRQERYVEDGGLLQAVLAFGRSGESLSAFANVAYAQDPEADDFEAEIRAAALYRVVRPLNVGLQASYRRDLGSTDQRRNNRVQPDYELVAGPVVTFAQGGWVLVIQGGVNVLEQASTQLSEVGVVAVGGIGTTF